MRSWLIYVACSLLGETAISSTSLLHYCIRVSEDAAVSADEDDIQSEDIYEDSFIDDEATPTGEFTQTEQGGRRSGDMMGFYR